MSTRWSDKRRTVPHTDQGDVSLADRSHSLGEVELYVWREADSAMVQWEHPQDPAPDLPEDVTWSLEKSCSPYGPWTPVASGLAKEVRRYRDDDVPQSRTNTRFVFYRLSSNSVQEDSSRQYGCTPQWEGLQQVGGVTWSFGGVPAHLTPGLIREMRKRFILLLSHANAEPCLVYRPDWMAGYDHKSVSNTTGTYKGDWGDNISANGQPFVGGYAHPFQTNIDSGPVQISMRLTQGRVVDLTTVQCEIPYWPPVLQDDILRFHNGTLAQVANIVPSTMHDHVISYIVQLSEIERTHPVNKLPVPEGFREASLFARRAASRTANVEAYQKSLDRGASRRASILPPTKAPILGEG